MNPCTTVPEQALARRHSRTPGEEGVKIGEPESDERLELHRIGPIPGRESIASQDVHILPLSIAYPGRHVDGLLRPQIGEVVEHHAEPDLLLNLADHIS